MRKEEGEVGGVGLLSADPLGRAGGGTAGSLWGTLGGRAFPAEKHAWGVPCAAPAQKATRLWKQGMEGGAFRRIYIYMFGDSRSGSATKNTAYYRPNPLPALVLSFHPHTLCVLEGEVWGRPEKMRARGNPGSRTLLGSRKGWLGPSSLGKAGRGSLARAVGSERRCLGAAAKGRCQTNHLGECREWAESSGSARDLPHGPRPKFT